MKKKITKEQLLGVGLAIVTPFIVAACGEEENCKCPAAADHFLQCVDYGCKVGKHKATPRGHIAEYQTNIQIPIYQTKGVDDDDAIATKDNIITDWATVDSDAKETLKDRIEAIWIIKEAANQTEFYDYEIINGKAILKMQYDNSWGPADMLGNFAGMIEGGVFSQAQPRDAVRLGRAQCQSPKNRSVVM